MDLSLLGNETLFERRGVAAGLATTLQVVPLKLLPNVGLRVRSSQAWPVRSRSPPGSLRLR